MDVFNGLEGVITILFEFIYKKAFNKKLEIKERIGYVIAYIVINLLIILGFSYLGILVLNNYLLSTIFFIISLIFTITLLYPFFREKKVKENKNE